jgi:hypothetical protein
VLRHLRRQQSLLVAPLRDNPDLVSFASAVAV